MFYLKWFWIGSHFKIFRWSNIFSRIFLRNLGCWTRYPKFNFTICSNSFLSRGLSSCFLILNGVFKYFLGKTTLNSFGFVRNMGFNLWSPPTTMTSTTSSNAFTSARASSCYSHVQFHKMVEQCSRQWRFWNTFKDSLFEMLFKWRRKLNIKDFKSYSLSEFFQNQI